MGRYSFRPQRVHDNVTALLKVGKLDRKPAWYDTVGSIRPPELLTRTQPLQHNKTGLGSGRQRRRKASKMFQPTEIRYPEDELRYTFFRDHHWELARPRIVTEGTGINGEETWDKIRQNGRALSGESVVQRQMYLMNHDNLTKSQAYDVARSEFYRHRLREDVERRVAREEALHYGAYFGKNRLEIGMGLEDAATEDWKAWADAEVTANEQVRLAGSAQADAGSAASASAGTEDPLIEELGEGEETPEGRTGQRAR